MPWGSETVTERKEKFIREYLQEVASKRTSMSELCSRYGISRQAGYEAIRSFDGEGWSGLRARSRAPRSGSHWTGEAERAAIIEMRKDYPSYGVRKILAVLIEKHPELRWPSPAAAHEIIRKAGLVESKGRPKRYPHPGPSIQDAPTRSNQLWSVDFKGQFRTRDRRWCYPLTITDNFSRYLFACEALEGTTLEDTWNVFVRVFREYGLPWAIRSDNGTPFASKSLGRLSRLSIRLIRLGILPDLIKPGHPQQNGRHERMHRTLKDAVCVDPATNTIAQQARFDTFKEEFNTFRPHEAIGQIPPARIHERSTRKYPEELPKVIYPPHFDTRSVRGTGEIKWAGPNSGRLFLSELLIGETVGVEEIADGVSVFYFGPVALATWSARDKRFTPYVKPGYGKEENK